MEVMLHSRTVSLLVLSTLALSGCGKGKNSDFPPSAEVKAQSGPVTHDFVKSLDQIYSFQYITDCELRRKDQIYAVARALDGYVAQGIVPVTNDPNYKVVDYSGFKVRENLKPIGQDEWKSNWSSWDDVIDRFEKAGPSPSVQKLERLRTYLGAMLTDDLSRTHWGMGNSISRATLGFPASVAAEIATCEKDSSCLSPSFSVNELAWLNSVPAFKESLAALKAAADQAKRLPILSELSRLVLLEDRNFFYKNSTVTLDASGVLHLPLAAHDFRGMTETLAHYIEPVWKSAALALQIDWRPDPEKRNGLYILDLDKGSLGRSYVLGSREEVHYFSGVRARSIAHEIGHVLGFSDRYYNSWNAESCKYTSEQNESDLMSENDTGKVPDSDFTTLIQQYGKAP